MRSRRHSKRAKSEMNVVPYIDVMLVLLVIFMISAPLLNQSVEVDLPQSANSQEIDAGNGETKPPLVVSIDRNGAYFIDQAGDEPLPVNKRTIEAVTQSTLSSDPTVEVYIRADKAVAYGEVMVVMDILKSSGAKSVGLITESEE